ncbi:RHS repeat domain-containing protein [Luteimonas terricola]|uniref:Teneurin-like YD-shell domain-containing protein n=1 Tax=Luteimonas terricola TaxID=645597 RepID=A0ABQ2EGK1_9GAMM|nr:RHS repeat-associated core domain-containing protein [Luteimonas terricola]GGK11742.1 hypothetical protein GCM10011394_21240 [Luteimonas terricola]
MAVRMVAAAVLWLLGSMGVAQAQNYGLHQKSLERINAAQAVAPLSVDTAFGEQVSHYNGSVQFANVDISIPGNTSIPVELRRRFAVQGHKGPSGLLGGMGEWDIDLPHLKGTFSSAAGWKVGPSNSVQRCSTTSAPQDTPLFQSHDYWDGYHLHVPGAVDEMLLHTPSSLIPAPGSGSYPWITKGMWRISCKASTKNDYGGEGFIAHSPDGLKYHLDWVVTRAYPSAKSGWTSGPGSSISRSVVYFLVSRVEDRFGNWVDYTYSGDKLTGISSNDLRQISLTWSGANVVTATSSVGTWSYTYASGRLSQVTQPDASKWTYTPTGNLVIETTDPEPIDDPFNNCLEGIVDWTGNFAYGVTAPSGAKAQYAFTILKHYRHNVPKICVKPTTTYQYLEIPNSTLNFTVSQKTVTGPGLPTMTWAYSYDTGHSLGFADMCASNPLICPPMKGNIVTGPGGTWTRYSYGMLYGVNEGQLLKVEQGGGPSAILRTQVNTHVANAEAAGQNFPASVGINPLGYSDQLSSNWLRPLRQSVTTQQGVNFTWQAGSACSGKLCFDAFARPTQVTKSSTVTGNPTRTEQTSYHDNTSLWALGQVAQVKCVAPTTALPAGCGSAGVVMSETSYQAAFALPLVSKRFGKTMQTLGWDTTSTVASGKRGTVKTVADGKGNTITLSSWKRGIPQSIKYPATPEAPTGATQSAVVSNAGWITSVTDENSFVTGYTYDAMGRLAGIVYPTGDSTAWNTTTQAFQQVTSAEYGIPAGHWRQTVSTGNGRKVTYFDGLWRPLVTREYDTANEAGTQRFQRFTYDHAGRTTFASYPATVHNPTTGSWNEYDTLGRPTSASQDSELGLLTTMTTYLTGFQTRVTSPKLYQTTMRFLAWDQPTSDFPVQVTHPEGAFTHITRDVFGKPTVLRRSNNSSPTGGTVALNRSYTYNAHQELCRSVEPETGATLMGYDLAGNLSWSAAGLPAATACHATGEHATINPRKVSRAYDARNRLTALGFANGIGNQAWTYTPDGLPATIATYNTSGGTLVTNAYTYNKRRMQTGESVKRGTAAAWAVGYGYNANGFLSSLVYPSGLTVNHAPNALGQPTQAGSYATGVSYFPNGAIKQFTYGNGVVHTLSQNARGLPARSTDCTLAGTCASANRRLDLQYAYDEHGNVSDITDHALGGRQTRGMSYDALDRLIQTTSGSTVFDTASYAYDVLDNLSTVHVSGGSQSRNHTYAYDPATWRLSQVKNTVGGTVVANLTYDVQGNLATKGAQTYQFDLGNRLRSVPGKEASYEYDGHGRRVYAQTVGSGQIVSQYAGSGPLLYQENHKQAKRIDYVYMGSSLVAFRERPLSGTTATVKYQHTDALGSPVAVTNAAKVLIESSEYEPYGQVVNKPLFDGPGYTGHVQDAATGLTYMQQRYYDPQLGVFLSVDPVTAYSNPVGQFNRYRYANNNPYSITDPDGRCGTRIPGRAAPNCISNGTGNISVESQNIDIKARRAAGAGATVIGASSATGGGGTASGALQTAGRILAGMVSAPVAAIVVGISAAVYSSEAGAGSDDVSSPYTLYHGTSEAHALAFLNGMVLSSSGATENHIHGQIGFYLATDPGAALAFSTYHSDRYAVLQFTISKEAMSSLIQSGARFQPIPQGGLRMTGVEFYVPVSSFGTFNGMIGSGGILITPYEGGF